MSLSSHANKEVTLVPDNTTSKPVVDLDVIDSFGATMARIFAQIVEVGLKDIEEQIQNLVDLNDVGDQDVMVRSAHSIKSCSAQMAGAELSAFAKQIEQQYIGGELASLQSDTEKFQHLFTRLKSEIMLVLEKRQEQS